MTDTDGAALQEQWNAVCDAARDAILAAERATGAAGIDRHLSDMRQSLAELRAAGNGRRRLPGTAPRSLSHDAPVQLDAADYQELWRRAHAVTELWRNGLGAPDWDWEGRGYPPGWRTSWYDRTLGRVFVRRL